jgi:hypothetical protein
MRHFGFSCEIELLLCYDRTSASHLHQRAGQLSGNAVSSYSGGAVFELRQAQQLCWLRFFVIFFSPSRQIPGYQLNQTKNNNFKVCSISLFANRPLIRPCVI